MAVPIKDRRFKLLIVLRALTLLDINPLKVKLNKNQEGYTDHFQQDALIKRCQNPTIERKIFRPLPTLKRTVGYPQDEGEEGPDVPMKKDESWRGTL